MSIIDFSYGSDGLISDFITTVLKEINKRPALRRVLIITFVILDLLSIIALILNSNMNLPFKEHVFNISLACTLLFSLGLIVIIFSYSTNMLNKISMSEKLTRLADEREIIEGKLEKGPSSTVQEKIKLNLNHLNEYYAINKSQSEKSFRFSIFMIATGFLLIVCAVAVLFMVPEKFTISLITGMTGLISEFIGATSLSLYKESNTHVNEFVKQLTYLQRVMLAIDLAEKIPEDKRIDQISSIINGLMKSE